MLVKTFKKGSRSLARCKKKKVFLWWFVSFTFVMLCLHANCLKSLWFVCLFIFNSLFLSSILIISLTFKQNKAIDVFTKTILGGIIISKQKEPIIAACIYLACRIENFPRTLDEVSFATGMDVKVISKMQQVISRKFQLPVGRLRPLHLVNRFAGRLKCTQPVSSLAAAMCQSIAQLDLMETIPPQVAAAGVIVAASMILRDVVNVRHVCDVALIATNSIKTVYRNLFPLLSTITAQFQCAPVFSASASRSSAACSSSSSSTSSSLRLGNNVSVSSASTACAAVDNNATIASNFNEVPISVLIKDLPSNLDKLLKTEVIIQALPAPVFAHKPISRLASSSIPQRSSSKSRSSSLSGEGVNEENMNLQLSDLLNDVTAPIVQTTAESALSNNNLEALLRKSSLACLNTNSSSTGDSIKSKSTHCVTLLAGDSTTEQPNKHGGKRTLDSSSLLPPNPNPSLAKKHRIDCSAVDQVV